MNRKEIFNSIPMQAFKVSNIRRYSHILRKHFKIKNDMINFTINQL